MSNPWMRNPHSSDGAWPEVEEVEWRREFLGRWVDEAVDYTEEQLAEIIEKVLK